MIQLLEGMPNNIVAASASGHVSADDYATVLMPAVDAALQDHDKVRLLYILESGFEGYEPEAALDDAKMGMHHWASFERMGLVTDRGSYRTLMKAFGFMMPGLVRVFTEDEVEDAKAWIVAT
jgi:hypothetical protein